MLLKAIVSIELSGCLQLEYNNDTVAVIKDGQIVCQIHLIVTIFLLCLCFAFDGEYHVTPHAVFTRLAMLLTPDVNWRKNNIYAHPLASFTSMLIPCPTL